VTGRGVQLAGKLARQRRARPILARQALTAPLLTPAEVFEVFLRASEAFRAGDQGTPISFYIGHAMAVADVGQFLPSRRDGSIDGYTSRIERLLDGPRFALILQHAQAFHEPLWRRLRHILRQIGESSDLSGRGAKASLFLGNYANTPFGLHRGNSNVYKFIIAGRKRIRLWPDASIQAQGAVQHTLDVARFGEPEHSIEGGPGDLIYWPSEFWHIGECIGGPATSLSLALFPVDPEEEEEPGASIKAREVRRLSRATSSGLGALPLAKKSLPALSPNARVQRNPDFPILHSPGQDGEMLCAANGHVFAVESHPQIAALCERLNQGGCVAVSALLARHAGRRKYELSRADVLAVLEKLRQIGAIQLPAGHEHVSHVTCDTC
jgi:hypothetical protein